MGLLVLDMDGTLVEDALIEIPTETGTKLQRRQDELYTEPVLLPNRYETLHSAAEEGDSFAIVSNQAGVAWGYHTQAEVYRRLTTTIGLLSCFWGQPFSVHVAFMHPRATLQQFKGNDGRKPEPTMVLEAMEKHKILDSAPPVPGMLMVGDRDEDREAAAGAGVDFVLAEDFFSS